ncbi:MAG TPA: PilW family protein [Solimonas sp.]
MSLIHSRPRQHRGLSMIEVMVGLLIGMISVLAIMRVFSLSEASRRTTSGGSDAQTNGTLAMYQLQRDLKQSGAGINRRMFGCTVTLRAGIAVSQFAPITINHPSIPAGDANTDTLLLISSTSSGAPEGAAVVGQPGQSQYSVQAPNAFATGDRVLALRQTLPSPCTLTAEAVTATAVSPAPLVTVATGVSGMSNGRLYNLGATPMAMAYAVRGGNLTACDLMASNCLATASASNATVWVPIASNIVTLRAQYARDGSSPMDGIIDTYDQTSPTTDCGWTRVLGARIVVVGRSAQYEKGSVTASANPAWAGSSGAPITLSGTGWDHYRYKLFETMATSRNVAWIGVVPGC